MPKVIKVAPAVLEYDKVEQSYSRASSERMEPATRAWWIMYYKNRTAQIAAHYKMDEDDLVTAWLKWRTELKQRDSALLTQPLPR